MILGPTNFRPGAKFGRLTLRQKVRRGPRVSANIRRQWLCDCDCGNRVTIPEYYLRRAANPKRDCSRCPDLYANRGITVQHSEVYRTWKNLQLRCYNTTHQGYHRYGGRGIKVCDEWLDPKEGFKRFLEHIGPKPSAAHSIDRYPDTDGNYQPGNVRWATLEQQAANKSKLKPISVTVANSSSLQESSTLTEAEVEVDQSQDDAESAGKA